MTAIALLKEAQQILEDLPCGGIGEGGPAQEELDEASERGHNVEGDAVHHQGQQAWLKIQKAIEMLKREDRLRTGYYGM